MLSYMLISDRVLLSFILNSTSPLLKTLLFCYTAFWHSILPLLFESVFITFYNSRTLPAIFLYIFKLYILWSSKIKHNHKLDSYF